MLVAARSPVQVGIVPWPGRRDLSTVVVKQTYEAVHCGVARLAPTQRILQVESKDERGGLVHPSDFVLAKRLCDVVFIGDVLARSGPARVAIGQLRKLVGAPRELGPLHAPGDPTDPTFGEAFGDGGDVQCAPVDQRMPWAALPMDLTYDLGAVRIATRIEGPCPEIVLLDRTGWTAPRRIELQMDTILVDVEASCIELLFRGLVEVHEGCDPLLVVGTEQHRKFGAREVEQWPRVEAIDPALLRRLRALTAVVDDGNATLPGDRGDPMETTARLQMATTTLPSPRRPAAAPEVVEPRAAPPAHAPSFGPPPPPMARPDSSPPAPVSSLPRPHLGGMMMLPLEVRSRPPPSPAPEPDSLTPTARATKEPGEHRDAGPREERPRLDSVAAEPPAPDTRPQLTTLADADDEPDDPLAGTVQATVPEELRRKPLPFVPPPSPSSPASPAPARSPARTLSLEEVTARPPMRSPARTLSVEEVAARPPVMRAPARTLSVEEVVSPPVTRTPARTASVEDAASGSDDGTLLMRGGAKATRALPFAPAAPGAPPVVAPPRPPREAAPERSTSGDASEIGTETVTTTAPPELRALPFMSRPAGAPPPTSSHDATPREPPRRSSTLPPRGDGTDAAPPYVGLTRPVTPVFSPVAPAAVATVAAPAIAPPAGDASPTKPDALSLDRFSAIRAELWGRRATRRDVLAKHGLTELTWRLAERKFMKDLTLRPPARVLAVVTRLRDEARQVGPPADEATPA